jgi:ABC-type transport system substrate-binding protein
MDQKDVRQAMNMAINRQEIINKLLGGRRPTQGLWLRARRT